MCPDLTSGGKDIEVTVSRRGEAFDVSAGKCIELQPGTYQISVEEGEVECDTLTVEVRGGQTTTVKLKCQATRATIMTIAGRWYDAQRFSVEIVGNGPVYQFSQFDPVGGRIGGRTAILRQDNVLTSEGSDLLYGPYRGEFQVSRNQIPGSVFYYLRNLRLPIILSR